MKQNVSIFFSSSSTFPSSMMWNWQLKILSLWKTTQESLHTLYFLYLFAEIKKSFSEYSAKNLGITCNFAAAIRISCRNFNKWIWKDKLSILVVQIYQKKKEWPYMEIYRPPKGSNSLKESITRHWRVQKQWLTALKYLFKFHSLRQLAPFR